MHYKDEYGKIPNHDHGSALNPISIFFDFDPQMCLPLNLVWKKEARPISVWPSHRLMDVCYVAERELNAYCADIGLPEYNLFVNVAWKGGSEDSLRAKSFVRDYFVDGDTMFVQADLEERQSERVVADGFVACDFWRLPLPTLDLMAALEDPGAV